MIIKLYWFRILVTIPLLVFLSFKASSFFRKKLKRYNILKRAVVLPIVLLILFAGIRSSFDSSTPNQGYYTFSTSNLKNEIANNSFFSVIHATYLLKKEVFYDYGEMSFKSAIDNINKMQGISESPDFKRIGTADNKRKKNVILVILESFGNEHVGYLGGTGTTPNLDSYTKESLYFTNLYATGERTSWGLSSILTSLYPIPSREYIKAAKSQKNFYTIARSFKKSGYTNTFLYGGDTNFDNMKGFFLSNGYDKVMGKEVFPRSKKRYSWGHCDEDLYEKAIEVLKKSDGKPFFLTLLTLSSHEPFDYPKGKTELYKGAKAEGFANSVKYADYALGIFIETLRSEGILENTVVALIADHCSNVRGGFTVPVEKYKIPGLILDEKYRKKGGERYEKIASQIDFGPTVLDVAGVGGSLPSMGVSVLKRSRDTALILSRRKNFAYLMNDRFVIFTGKRKIQTYNYKFEKIKNRAGDLKYGLSYIYGSKYFYDNKELYSLR